jgi:hypothetical protein
LITSPPTVSLCCAATDVQPNAIPNAAAAITQVRDIEDFI